MCDGSSANQGVFQSRDFAHRLKTMLAKPITVGIFSIDMSERFTPRAAVEFWASRHGVSVDQLGLSPSVVGSWDLVTVMSLARTVGAEPSASWWWPRFRVYGGEGGGGMVASVLLLW